MNDTQDERLRLAAARADFLDSGEASGVPDVVAASWRRSRSAGVEHDDYHVAYHQDIDTDSRLARCARPVLERLTLDMDDVPVSIALADARARIIDRRDCSSAVGRVLDRVDFNPGFSFAEHGVGTNGIGTAYEAGQTVSVVGPAHFNESLTPFACTGAPVIDPLSGRLEGVLDVSLLAESWSPLIHAMVRTAASDIGRNLMLDRSRAQQALFETYVRADARSRHAVVAVGDTVILNQRAQHLLAPADQVVLQHHARYLMTRSTVTADVVALPDGRALHLRVLRVRVGDDTSGVVLLVSETPHHQSPAVSTAATGVSSDVDLLPQHHAPVLEPPEVPRSRTPAWDRAWQDTRLALEAGHSVVVTGEPGAGRLSLLTEVFARLRPEGRQVVLHPEDLASGPPEPGYADGAALVVLRDLDRLDAPGAATAADLAAALAADLAAALVRTDGVRLAATLSGDLPETHPAATLLTRFSCGVPVPALRHRVGDIPHLAATALAELAPGRRVRVSPDAMRVLTAYSWPRNLPQLRETLAAALTRRPVGEIQADDLPGHCRTSTSRALTPIETAERDAIVAALREHGGNRVHAATALGMSRSSLYRKLKHYALHDL